MTDKAYKIRDRQNGQFLKTPVSGHASWFAWTPEGGDIYPSRRSLYNSAAYRVLKKENRDWEAVEYDLVETGTFRPGQK